MNSNMTANVTDCWSFLGTIGTPVITWPECDRISLKWILKFHSKDYIHFSFLTKLFSYSQIKNSIPDLSLTGLICNKWKKKIGYTFCWTRKKNLLFTTRFFYILMIFWNMFVLNILLLFASITAVGTFEWFFACMSSNMIFHMMFLFHQFLTEWTFV